MERLLRKETERKYQQGDTVQGILRRAREFRISSSAFKLSTNERKAKMNFSHDATQKYPYNVYPDMADCLDSTIEGFSMMPFSHQWLLQSGSKRSEKQHAVNKNAHMKPKSLLAEKEKDGYLQNNKNNIELQKERDAEQKPVRIDTRVDQKSVQIDNRADQKPLCIDNGTDQKTTVLPFSLDDYMAAMDRAQQTLLKYSTTEQEKDIDKENPVKQQVNTSDRNIEEKTAADTADQYSKEKAKDSNKRKKQEDIVDTINKINKQSVRVDTINKENMAVDNTNKDIKQEGRVDIVYRNTNLKEKVDTMNKEEHKDIVEYDKEKAETTGTLCKGIKGEAREDTINKDTKRVVDIISNKDKDANADASIKHESTVDNNHSREDAEDQFGGHDVLIDTGKQKDDWKPIVVAVNTTGKGDPKTRIRF